MLHNSKFSPRVRSRDYEKILKVVNLRMTNASGSSTRFVCGGLLPPATKSSHLDQIFRMIYLISWFKNKLCLEGSCSRFYMESGNSSLTYKTLHKYISREINTVSMKSQSLKQYRKVRLVDSRSETASIGPSISTFAWDLLTLEFHEVLLSHPGTLSSIKMGHESFVD